MEALVVSRRQRNRIALFQSNWVGIVLTIVSIIQGLALAHLSDVATGLAGLVPWCFFCLAFLVSVRVFQTYVSAAVEYDHWRPNVWDLLLIFFLGFVQYRYIDALGPNLFRPRTFQLWFLVLCSLALIGYCRALWIIGTRVEPATRKRERNLQRINLAGTAMCLGLAVPFLFLVLSRWVTVGLVLTQSLVIFLNTYASLDQTLMSHGLGKQRLSRRQPKQYERQSVEPENKE